MSERHDTSRRPRNRPPADADDFPDAVFRVTADDGSEWFVSASYEGGAGWQQWGAPPEVLRSSVSIVEAWATVIYEQRRAAGYEDDPEEGDPA